MDGTSSPTYQANAIADELRVLYIVFFFLCKWYNISIRISIQGGRMAKNTDKQLEKMKKEAYNNAPNFFDDKTIEKFKNNLGKPLKYSPDELISEVFKYINEDLKVVDVIPQRDKEGNIIGYKDIVKRRLASRVGFCVHLGTGKNYLTQLKDATGVDYSVTLKTIEDIMEQYNSIIIDDKETTRTWDIFYMKNVHGWTDKVETKNDNNNINTEVVRVIGDEPLE